VSNGHDETGLGFYPTNWTLVHDGANIFGVVQEQAGKCTILSVLAKL
jgi:hypothetical protein